MNECKCHVCKKTFHDDILVPDSVWELIAPKKITGWKGGGLLCGQCILDRTLLYLEKELLLRTKQLYTAIETLTSKTKQ